MGGIDLSKCLQGPCLLLLLLFTCATYAQVALPEIPPQVVLSKVLEADSPDNSACNQACADVAFRYPESVFIGQTGNFDLWDAKQAEIVPACRVEPSSTEALAWMLKTTIQHNCHFAIRSGGHERTAGASNADGGVTFDLVLLNRIEIAENKQSIVIGAGLLWVDVFEALEKEHLMVLGGRIADVGVGGLLLGGGISFFSNERGLACDSIISYELILPNSSVVTVDRQTNPDLYKALRGAGAANFGIVTSFTLEVFPLPNHGNMWSASKLFAWNDVPKLLEANHKVNTEAMDADSGIAVMQIFACHPDHDMCFGAVQAQHSTHQSIKEWPDMLKLYDGIPAFQNIVKLDIAAVSDITKRLEDRTTSGKLRTIYGVFSYTPSIALETQILEIFREEVRLVGKMVGFLPGVIMHPQSRRAISKMRKNGGNALGTLANHKEPLIISNVSWQWREKSDDEKAYASYHQFMARIEAAAKEHGVWHPYKYINYAEASQDVWEGYGDLLGELRHIQREVDPTGIFARGGLAGGAHKLNTREPKPPEPTDKASDHWDKSEL